MEILIYALVALSLILFLYVKQVQKLLMQIEEIRKQKLWPIAWLWISFIPFLGTYILKKAGGYSFDYHFIVMPKKASTINPLTYRNTRWVLFQEQYDRKTSMHHGTRLRFLEEKTQYKFVSSSTAKPVNEQNKVFIEVARRPQSDVLWASLNSQSPHWMLVNYKTDVVYPVIDGPESNPRIRSCRPGRAEILRGQERFVVGLSEFQLLSLPSLFMLWEEHAVHKFIALTDDRIVSTELGLENPSVLYWEINERILTAHHPIKYTRILSDTSIELNAGQKAIILPGDQFSIPGTQLSFRFDYLVS